MSPVADLSVEVRELFFKELRLKGSPEDFPVDQPLLDPGKPVAVAMDSLDVMSMVLKVEEEYGVRFPEDARELSLIFASIQSVAENIVRLRAEAAQGA
jgi:acyl carrier protein